MKIERQQGSFMRPIFEQASLRFPAPGRAIQQLPIIGPQPRESGEIMRSGDDVDAVDLMQRKTIEKPAKMTLIRALGPLASESLGREDDSASLGKGQAFSHAAWV